MPELPKHKESLDLSAFAESAKAVMRMHDSLGFKMTQETLKSIAQTQDRMREAIAPYEEVVKRAQDFAREITRPIFLGDTSFLIAPARREYPSTEEIAEAVVQKIQRGQKMPLKTASEKVVAVPDDTRWENIRVDFCDNRSVDVFHNAELVGNYDLKDFKLTRRSKGKILPDRQAEFLQQLALASMAKNLKPTVGYMADALKISESDCHQVKRILSNKLKKVFGITSDPFYPYNRTDGYRLRLELRPEPLLRGDGRVHASGGRFFDETFQDEEEE